MFFGHFYSWWSWAWGQWIGVKFVYRDKIIWIKKGKWLAYLLPYDLNRKRKVGESIVNTFCSCTKSGLQILLPVLYSRGKLIPNANRMYKESLCLGLSVHDLSPCTWTVLQTGDACSSARSARVFADAWHSQNILLKQGHVFLWGLERCYTGHNGDVWYNEFSL